MENLEITTIYRPKISTEKALNIVDNYLINLPKFNQLNVDAMISTERVDNNYYLVIDCTEDNSKVITKCPISKDTYLDISNHVERIMICANLL